MSGNRQNVRASDSRLGGDAAIPQRNGRLATPAAWPPLRHGDHVGVEWKLCELRGTFYLGRPWDWSIRPAPPIWARSTHAEVPGSLVRFRAACSAVPGFAGGGVLDILFWSFSARSWYRLGRLDRDRHPVHGACPQLVKQQMIGEVIDADTRVGVGHDQPGAV